MNESLKKWIDNSSYYHLLEKNRFGKSEDPIFQGEIGVYFMGALKNKGNELSSGEKTSISKQIGWNG